MELPKKVEYFRCNGWYEYGCNKLISNISKIDNIFKRKYVSSVDVIEYLTYVDPKICQYLPQAIDMIAKSLRYIEDAIAKGKFANMATISTFTSVHMKSYIHNMHDMNMLSELVHHIKESVYMSYLQVHPEISGITYMFPKKPTVVLNDITADVKDTDNVQKVINTVRPYANVLEQYQLDIIRLLYQVQNALGIVIKHFIK